MKLKSIPILASVALLSLAGCQQKSNESAAGVAKPELPISINAVMVSTIDHASDYMFAIGNGDMPKSDHDWYLVENSAYETMLGGRIIQFAGTGSNDAAWVADPEWKQLADQLTSLGEEGLKLAKARDSDQKKWMDLGNRLVDDCLACHQKFKPEIPSQGILHEATRRESEGKSAFGD
jgi:hypothetical protein